MDSYDSWKTACCSKYPCCRDCDKEEKIVVYTCSCCDEPIYEGQECFETQEGILCMDCVKGNTIIAKRG